MKKITHMETKTTEVEVVDGYMAEDGKIFPDEKSCENHEFDLHNKEIVNIRHFAFNPIDILDEAYDDEQYVIFYPKNEKEVETICKQCRDIKPDMFEDNKPQMFLMIYGGYGETFEGQEYFDTPADTYHLGDPEAFFTKTINAVHKMWVLTNSGIGYGIDN